MRTAPKHPFIRWACDGSPRHRVFKFLWTFGRERPWRALIREICFLWMAAEHAYWRTFIRREDRFGETDWTPLP